MSKMVEAYKCDWCSRCFGRKCDVNRHEEACNNNPVRQHCKTCVNGLWTVISQTEDAFDRDYPVDLYGPFCGYHNKPIFEKPYYIECDTHNYGGWGPERPVPGTCLAYKYKGKAGWTVINNKIKGAEL